MQGPNEHAYEPSLPKTSGARKRVQKWNKINRAISSSTGNDLSFLPVGEKRMVHSVTADTYFFEEEGREKVKKRIVPMEVDNNNEADSGNVVGLTTWALPSQ